MAGHIISVLHYGALYGHSIEQTTLWVGFPFFLIYFVTNKKKGEICNFTIDIHSPEVSSARNGVFICLFFFEEKKIPFFLGTEHLRS